MMTKEGQILIIKENCITLPVGENLLGKYNPGWKLISDENLPKVHFLHVIGRARFIPLGHPGQNLI